MDIDLEKMFKEYLRNDCISLGYFCDIISLKNYLYINFGITEEDYENGVSIYSDGISYYIPKNDFKRVLSEVRL